MIFVKSACSTILVWLDSDLCIKATTCIEMPSYTLVLCSTYEENQSYKRKLHQFGYELVKNH